MKYKGNPLTQKETQKRVKMFEKNLFYGEEKILSGVNMTHE